MSKCANQDKAFFCPVLSKFESCLFCSLDGSIVVLSVPSPCCEDHSDCLLTPLHYCLKMFYQYPTSFFTKSKDMSVKDTLRDTLTALQRRHDIFTFSHKGPFQCYSIMLEMLFKHTQRVTAGLFQNATKIFFERHFTYH